MVCEKCGKEMKEFDGGIGCEDCGTCSITISTETIISQHNESLIRDCVKIANERVYWENGVFKIKGGIE